MKNKITLLSQTSEMMCSDNYDVRFKAEYYQLKIRHDSLAEIITKYRNGKLAFKLSCGIYLLESQLFVMTNYLDILKRRAEIEGIKLND